MPSGLTQWAGPFSRQYGNSAIRHYGYDLSTRRHGWLGSVASRQVCPTGPFGSMAVRQLSSPAMMDTRYPSLTTRHFITPSLHPFVTPPLGKILPDRIEQVPTNLDNTKVHRNAGDEARPRAPVRR
jgi:hypothetical protein